MDPNAAINVPARTACSVLHCNYQLGWVPTGSCLRASDPRSRKDYHMSGVGGVVKIYGTMSD
jgi:hypothetical protein